MKRDPRMYQPLQGAPEGPATLNDLASLLEQNPENN